MSLDRDRFLGALIGLAIGDALGAPLEFAPRDALPAVTGMQSGGRFHLEAGQWTDDTSMALCIASSLIETKTFDLRDQLTRFVRWRDEGYLTSTGKCFGIGQQTFWALNDFDQSGTVARSQSRRWRSGNGSLMRVAPVAMVFADDPDMATSASGASSLTTHPLIECQEACSAYAALIAEAILGWDRQEIIADAQRRASRIRTPAVQDVLAGKYLGASRDEISSSGYVVDTMEAALWAFTQTRDFEAGALLAVNLGHDADTVGAVYGQLAGAHYGLSGIPDEWRNQLHALDTIFEIADDLYDCVSAVKVTEETAAYLRAESA